MTIPVSNRFDGVLSAGASTGRAGLVPVVTIVAPSASSVMGPNGPFRPGQLWIDTVANTSYILTSLASSSGVVTAVWTISGAAAGTLDTLTGDSGGAISPSTGNINILGTAGQLTTTGSGSSITLSLPSSILTPGSLEVGTTLTVDGASTFTGLTTLGPLTQVGTANINATGTAVTTIGSSSGASGISEHVGTGNFSLDGVGASTYAIGASTTTGTIAIGGTAQTGAITLGSSSGTNVVNIGGGAGNTTVNIANAANAGAVNIGAGATTATVTIGGAAATGTITLGSSTGTNLVAIAAGVGIGTVNIATGAIGAKAVNIASGNSVNTVVIGSTNTTSTTTLQAGSGGIILTGAVTGSSSITADTTLTATLGNITATNGNLNLAHTGNKLLIHATTAASDAIGTATLTSGVVVVSTTAVTASSLILVTYKTCASALASSLSYGTIIAGTSFTITSQDLTDSTSVVQYLIIN